MSTIAEWLASLGMSEYSERFGEERIEIDVLSELTDRDLERLGISLGHRRRMLRAIRERGAAAPATPQAVVASPALQESAERRQITVVFCDLVGSTALSGEFDLEDLRGIIGAYNRCCTELIERNGGFVAKYMGDGVLAYFGYPEAHEHDAERGVRAGLALVEAVPKLTTAAVPLQVRVGIATGLVVVGDLIGSGAAQEQVVVGETPNLAARLQALAAPGAVVIASSTRRLTGGLFEYRDLGSVALKGFADNVAAWQVLRAGTVESRFEALRTTTTPLVGRDKEIELLLRGWEQAKRGDGTVVLISGEPGIGKSRIAQTIVERLSNESHTRLRYFCSPHHRDSALYPTITQLQRAAGFQRDDTDEQRLDKLEAVFAETTNDLSLVVPLLADLLSVRTDARYPPLSLTPQKRKEKTLRALLAQFEELATHRPVLTVYEDAQWIDPTSLELLDLTVDRVMALPVLLLITFRPEFAPRWIDRSHVKLVRLGGLPHRQRPEMITRVTGGKPVPKEIADQIVDRTDGVPLFIEELTKNVLESGIVIEAGDHYAVKDPTAPIAIPTTLHASLLARLDRLGPTRAVAQIAAALGRQFSHEIISAVAEVPRQTLDDALTQLMRAELIFQRGTPPDAEYRFKHALVQDAAYGTLLRSRRRQLHARVAATLEDQFPEIVVAQPALLARHCAEAELAEKAVGYWLKAGQQAWARSATTEAVAQLQKALDVLAGLPDSPWCQRQELDLRIALRPALAATKGASAREAGENIARARALAEQIDRPEYLAPLLHGQWAHHLVRAEYKLALALAEQMEKNGKARNDVAAQLQGRRATAWTRLNLGEVVAARALLERCHGLADPVLRARRGGWVDPYVGVLATLALTLAYQGYIKQARLRLNEALSEARRLKHAQVLAEVLLNANVIEWIIRSPKMHRYAEELLDLSTEHGFPYFLGWATVFRGSSLTARRQAREGLTLVTQGLAAVRATGTVMSTPRALMLLAEVYAILGQPVEGLNCLAEAAQIVETTEERVGEAELHRLRGDLLYAVVDLAEAQQSYHQALAVAERQSAKLFELRAAMGLARLWRDQGKRGGAGDLLAPIYGWFTEGFDTPVLQDAKALLDQLA